MRLATSVNFNAVLGSGREDDAECQLVLWKARHLCPDRKGSGFVGQAPFGPRLSEGGLQPRPDQNTGLRRRRLVFFEEQHGQSHRTRQLGDLGCGVYCCDCYHERDVSPATVPLPPPVPEISERMKCSACGSRKIDARPEQYPGGVTKMR